MLHIDIPHGSTPAEVRIGKLPKVITHELRLVGVSPQLGQFLAETSGPGPKRGPILVQLPPSFAFDSRTAESFCTELRNRFDGGVVLEPRHETWFTPDVYWLLATQSVARVAADPARVPVAAEPGGYDRLAYYRLHGSPRIYYSAYSNETLTEIARALDDKAAHGVVTWCVFDNTALGAAATDALAVKTILSSSQRVTL